MRKIQRKIITLCGSTKFKEAFEFWNKHLSLMEKAVVLSVAGFMHRDESPITVEQKVLLDEIYRDKILLSDFVFIIDVAGYIGQSTKAEIEFAKKQEIPVVYMSEYVVAIKPADRPDELNGSLIFRDGTSLGWFLPQQRVQFANSKEKYTEEQMTWGKYKRDYNIKFDPSTKEIITP